jgi:hypothetical protein
LALMDYIGLQMLMPSSETLTSAAIPLGNILHHDSAS